MHMAAAAEQAAAEAAVMAGQTFSAVAAQRDTSAAARDRALLGRLRESTQTHDARLECAGGSLTAHRCILAAASPTLEAHFYGGMAPAPQLDGMVLKQLGDVSLACAEVFVAHCYDGPAAPFPPENALPLLELARELAVASLTERCVACLVENMCAENAVDSLLYGFEYSAEGLIAVARRTVCTAFSRIDGGALSRLPAAELARALRSCELEVATEEEAFGALVGWESRQASPPSPEELLSLLSAIRFRSMAASFLREVVSTHPLLARATPDQAAKAAVLAIADSVEGAARARGKRRRGAAGADTAAGSSSNSSSTDTRLSGEFTSPSDERARVKVARAAGEGVVIAYDENEAAEPRGILHWLGTGAGTKEWSNPATDGLVDIRSNVRRLNETNFYITEWVSAPLMATTFAKELSYDCVGTSMAAEACEVDLKRSVIVTGIAIQGSDYSRDDLADGTTLVLLGSDDGDSWQEFQRWECSGENFVRLPVASDDDEYFPRFYFCVEADAAAAAYRRFRLVSDEKGGTEAIVGLRRLEIFGALPATAPDSPEAGAGRKKKRSVR